MLPQSTSRRGRNVSTHSRALLGRDLHALLYALSSNFKVRREDVLQSLSSVEQSLHEVTQTLEDSLLKRTRNQLQAHFDEIGTFLGDLITKDLSLRVVYTDKLIKQRDQTVAHPFAYSSQLQDSQLIAGFDAYTALRNNSHILVRRAL